MIEDYNIFAITNPLYSITFLMMHEGNSVKRGRGKELLLVGWVVHKKQRGLCLPIFLSCLRGAQTSIFSLLSISAATHTPKTTSLSFLSFLVSLLSCYGISSIKVGNSFKTNLFIGCFRCWSRYCTCRRHRSSDFRGYISPRMAHECSRLWWKQYNLQQ